MARSPRALSPQERAQVLATLNEERFCNLAPAEVYATLLDEGTYLCSERTMYRILDEHSQLRERRNQLRHPSYAAPELMATKPNQLWSWDITKLKTFVKSQYFHLYVILDVFSRYVVGWMVADHESGDLAQALIDQTCARQGITPGSLTFHADNGSAMVSQPVAFLLASLGITKSHSRPHTSDDNPFSEAQFKTLKYRPDFPERFASQPGARDYLAYFDNSAFWAHEGIPEKFRHECDFYYSKGRQGGDPLSEIAPSCYRRDTAAPHALFIWGDSYAQMLKEDLFAPLQEFGERGLRVGDDLVAAVMGRLEGALPGSLGLVLEPEEAFAWARIGGAKDALESFVTLGRALLEGIATALTEGLRRETVFVEGRLVEAAEACLLAATHAPSDTLVVSARLRINARDEALSAVVHLLVEPKHFSRLLSALAAAIH